ncbi:MAG: radical SAM protein [Syntrophales bacterium]|nr:radical SAM protein [Syntrophales bacterium]
MAITERVVKSVLSPSKIYDYALNPYIGCSHGCRYCYAQFMKRFTGHKEPWGTFVDVKINAPELLTRELDKKKRGRVWVSGVCDPYQPAEEKFIITRRCLEMLISRGWAFTIQTKSALVLRDMDLFLKARDCEVGFSITTTDDGIRRLFEPNAAPIDMRIEALDKMHSLGIRTYAMIAPILPGAEDLVKDLKGKVDYIIVDRLNYHYADRVFKAHSLPLASEEDFYRPVVNRIRNMCRDAQIPCEIIC